MKDCYRECNHKRCKSDKEQNCQACLDFCTECGEWAHYNRVKASLGR